MCKRAKSHSKDDFGKTSTAGGQFAGLDGPMIGAPASIIVDSISERESGVTPPPPPVSVRTLVIVLVVMFVLGAIALALALRSLPGVNGVPVQL
jgi:hypothetical protein